MEALLAMECEERDRHAIADRIRDARMPRAISLEEFDFAQSPKIPAARLREMAEGGYMPPADVGAEFLFQVIADRAHSIDTGKESFRFRRTADRRKKR